jgi:hypothetical protein
MRVADTGGWGEKMVKSLEILAQFSGDKVFQVR